MNVEFAMEVLGISRFEACWYTPAVTLRRMQMAWMEHQGKEQSWAKSRLDKIMDAEINGE